MVEILNNGIVCALEVFLALHLGIAGITKLLTPQHFAIVLRQQHIIPKWSIKGVTYTLPTVEVLTAVILIIEVSHPLTKGLTLLLFSTFLVVKLILFAKKSNADCGCKGKHSTEQVDLASVTVSVILFLITLIYYNLPIYEQVMSIWVWQLFKLVIFVTICGWLLTLRTKPKVRLL